MSGETALYLLGAVLAFVGYLTARDFAEMWFPRADAGFIDTLTKRMKVIHIITGVIFIASAFWYYVRGA